MSQVLICAAQARCAELLNCVNCYIPCTVANNYYALGNTATYGTAYTSGCANGFNQTCTSIVNQIAGTYNKANTGGWTCSAYRCYQDSVKALQLMPWCTTYYASIPTLPGGTTSTAGTNPDTGVEYSGLKVCATNFCAGAACTWTVPSGAKLARFQIWGPGGSSGTGCCCGGSPTGTTGAYASIIIPVVAGCQYTLCAGCGCCCTMGWHNRTSASRGGASYITGFGLSNFCAMGGLDICLTNQLSQDMCTPYYCGCYRFASPDCFSAGSCTCNSFNDFCFSNSCSTCGWIWFSTSQSTKYYGCYTGNLYANPLQDSCLYYGTQVAGINGINSATCYDTNFYGVYRHPPIYGFESVSQCCLCFAASSTGGMLGGCWDHFGANYMRYPGAGGTGTALFGGCTLPCDPNFSGICGGGRGRSGMVCVTYW